MSCGILSRMRKGLLLATMLFVVGCGSEPPLTPTTPPPPVSSSDPFSLTLSAAIGSGDQAGRATVTATVRNVAGVGLGSVPVSFSTDVGALATGSTMTAPDGTASTQLVASQTAHVKASAGTLTQQTLVAAEPAPTGTFPPSPPLVNPPPPIIPPPTPPVVPPPALTVVLTASAGSAPAATPPATSTLDFTATVTNLETGETITSYQWDLDGNGAYEFTSIGLSPQTRTSGSYTIGGLFTAHVLVTSSLGRTAQGSVNFVVTN